MRKHIKVMYDIRAEIEKTNDTAWIHRMPNGEIIVSLEVISGFKRCGDTLIMRSHFKNVKRKVKYLKKQYPEFVFKIYRHELHRYKQKDGFHFMKYLWYE